MMPVSVAVAALLLLVAILQLTCLAADAGKYSLRRNTCEH